MIKEIYGVKIFPLVVMFYQVRRWWALWKLRKHWRDDQFFIKLARQRKYQWISDYFNFYERYRFLRLLTKAEQQRGKI